MITLNVYNGDVLGVQENIEYGLWFFAPLFLNTCIDICKHTPPWQSPYQNYYLIWILGTTCNIYWYYATPFEKSRSLRHRTEYYDTQTFLAAISFSELTRIKKASKVSKPPPDYKGDLIINESGTSNTETFLENP